LSWSLLLLDLWASLPEPAARQQHMQQCQHTRSSDISNAGFDNAGLTVGDCAPVPDKSAGLTVCLPPDYGAQFGLLLLSEQQSLRA